MGFSYAVSRNNYTYYERRIPLARMQMELRAAGHEKEWKGAA